ncbi:hypothetical protein [Pseudomonas guariconensis]|uniref:hypothetical protein n=1 Tax=Pseudomonas guariconensis TaxID=1288410 RepID=UPI0036F33E46
MSEFDAQSITARLKAESRIRRKPRTYAQRRSLLDNYKFELLQLDQAGCNGSELQRWVAEKGIKIQRSTVHRWLHRNRLRIPRHPATQSTLIWPGIPRPSGHLFHGHPAGQSERSDAGVALLVRVGWRRQFLRPFAH